MVTQFDAFHNSVSKKYHNTDVILHSGGGDPDAAYHLGIMLSEWTGGTLIFIIPRYAKSAATLLSFSGNEVVMFDAAELGPIDPQIVRKDGTQFSALALKSMLDLLNKETKNGNDATVEILAGKLGPLDLGEIERTLAISKRYANSLLVKRMFKGKTEDDGDVNKISKKLTEGYTHHNYLIEFNEAVNLGLRVRKPEKELADRVNELYQIQMRLSELVMIDRIVGSYNNTRVDK